MAGIHLLADGLQKFRKIQKIQDTTRINIASAPQGLVEIEGYVWPLEPTHVAFCGRQTICYHYEVQQFVKRNKDSYWETKYELKNNASFYVFDQTGVCIVKPRSQERLDLTVDVYELSFYAESLKELRKSIQASSNFSNKKSNDSYRLIEHKLLVGSPVYVCGSLQTKNLNRAAIQGDYKKFLTHVKAINSNSNIKKKKFDIDKNGFVAEDELIKGFSDISKLSQFDPIVLDAKVVGTIVSTVDHKLIVSNDDKVNYLQKISSFNSVQIWIGAAMIIYLIYSLFRLIGF